MVLAPLELMPYVSIGGQATSQPSANALAPVGRAPAMAATSSTVERLAAGVQGVSTEVGEQPPTDAGPVVVTTREEPPVVQATLPAAGQAEEVTHPARAVDVPQPVVFPSPQPLAPAEVPAAGAIVPAGGLP